MSTAPRTTRPAFDREMVDIADYVTGHKIKGTLAYTTARYCLMDTIGCGLEALSYPACTKLMGPVVPGAVMPGGARVPGTPFELDPITAAFNIGAMNRWLDFNDSWFGRNGAHPSPHSIQTLISDQRAAGAPLARARRRRISPDFEGR